jgi:hypothetical protein
MLRLLRGNAGSVVYAINRSEIDNKTSSFANTHESVQQHRPNVPLRRHEKKTSEEEWEIQYRDTLNRITTAMMTTMENLYVRGYHVNVQDADKFKTDVRRYCYKTFDHDRQLSLDN